MSTAGRLYGADLYTWVSMDGDEVTIGFTNYSCERMEEMVAVELKQPGEEIRQGEPCGQVDVMKALIDIPAPISGIVLAVNAEAVDAPDMIREDPFGKYWLLKVRATNPAERDGLVSEAEYAAHTAPKPDAGLRLL